MAFSALAVMVVAIAFVLIALIGMTPVLAIPIVLLVAAIGVGAWLALGRLRDTEIVSGPGASGVPTTREAAYDPINRPRDH
jgi:uncharacterized membrane protein YhhN